MKFRKIMQLWIAGLVISVSAVAYAADEDHLTVSPSEKGRPGIFEVTVFGTRDSDKAEIAHYSYSISAASVSSGTNADLDGGTSIDFYLTITKGSSSGQSNYQRKFNIFLPIGYYGLILWVRDSPGRDYRLIDIAPAGSNYMSLAVTEPPISISLQNATAEISGTDSFTLRNFTAEIDRGKGAVEKYNAWGKFHWNPYSLSWELKDAGTEK